MKKHSKHYQTRPGFACGGAVKICGMEGSVVLQAAIIPYRSVTRFRPVRRKAWLRLPTWLTAFPQQAAATPGSPLANVRQFGDFGFGHTQPAGMAYGTPIPAATPVLRLELPINLVGA